MIASLFLALITLFDIQEKDHSLKITASDNDLRLNEPLNIEITALPSLADAEIARLERELATQREEGLLTFFLSAKNQTQGKVTFTLLPQFAGHFTISLSPIQFEGLPRDISPFPLSVEPFPAFDEPLAPAPPMPLDSRDPLEVDEVNKRKLQAINTRDDASDLLKERSIPFMNWMALLIGTGLFTVLYLSRNRSQETTKSKTISRNDALELFNLAKTLPKKQGLEIIHNLLMQYRKEGVNPAFIDKLNQLRFQQDDPSNDEWKALIKSVTDYLKTR